MHHALATQDPFAQLRRNFFGRSAPSQSNQKTKANLAINIYEDENAYLIRTRLAGFSVEDIEIEVVKNQVSIRGTRKEETSEEDIKLHRQERNVFTFERTFALPETVDPDKVRANFKNGLLEIILDKDEKAKAKRIKITEGAV